MIALYFNNWVGWLCCVDRLVAEAIHNQVSIKLLLSGLFILMYMLCTPVFTS